MITDESQGVLKNIVEWSDYLMPEFKTIRQTAATGILSEHRLRLLVAEGKCPGIRTGNRFLVNVPALAEMLDKESRAGVCANE